MKIGEPKDRSSFEVCFHFYWGITSRGFAALKWMNEGIWNYVIFTTKTEKFICSTTFRFAGADESLVYLLKNPYRSK